MPVVDLSWLSIPPSCQIADDRDGDAAKPKAMHSYPTACHSEQQQDVYKTVPKTVPKVGSTQT